MTTHSFLTPESPAPTQPPLLKTVLAGLNARQLEAVTHTQGPLLVVAGPGTGKTQLLAARIAWLLHQPDAPQPSEILCLTYTDAAARNMRDRLLGLLGSAAHQVFILTFHGFGQLVIQENADLLGFHGLEVASEAETQKLYVELIDGLPPGHILRHDTGSPYYEIENLKPFFETMKKEGWTGAQIIAAVEEYRQTLPTLPDYRYQKNLPAQGVKKGDLKVSALAKDEHRLDKTAAAAALFAPFQQMWRKANRYDYADMLGWAMALLTDYEAVRLHYQEKFQHFLVDEYQDTNGIQNRLLHLLAGGATAPNILVVGDDDQSVFRSQGACVANILEFTYQYPTANVVVLEENYRSSAHVLAAASSLIALNQERLTVQHPTITKTLVARHSTFAASPVVPFIRCYETPLHEAAGIAAELADLHRAGLPAGGCAVLAHDHVQLNDVAQLLTAQGVPFYRKRPVNVLVEETLATSLHRVLRYLSATLHKEATPGVAEPDLFSLLHLACFGIPAVDLVRLAASHKQKFPRGATGYPWREWLDDAVADEQMAAELRLSAAGRQALGRALDLLDSWMKATMNQPVAKAVKLILLNTLLPWQLMHYPHPAHEHTVAYTLLKFARTVNGQQPSLTMAGFLQAWEIVEATKEGLPLEQATGTEHAGVQLLTAHSAKGLEFERIWITGCQRRAWLKGGDHKGYRLPPSLLLTPAPGTELEEARRLFFVALTRAQEHLTISYASHDEQANSAPPCPFVNELADAGIRVLQATVDEETLAVTRQQLHSPVPLPVPLPDSAALDVILENFVMSATTLNSYLRCPIGCYYEHLLHVPAPRNEYLVFGSAVHQALEKYFRQMQSHEQHTFGPPETLVDAFEKQLWLDRLELDAATYLRRRVAGRKLLLDLHATYHAEWPTTAIVEHRVERTILPNGIALTGAIDRLDPHPAGGYHVIDYKTGNPDNAPAKLKAATAADATLLQWHEDSAARGGDHWRQAVCYYLLLKHDPDQNYAPTAISFHFVEPQKAPGQPPTYRFQAVPITAEAEAQVLAQIQAVDAAIRARNFSYGCGKCRWCLLRPTSNGLCAEG